MGGHVPNMTKPLDYDGGVKASIQKRVGVEGLSLLEQRQLLAENHLLTFELRKLREKGKGADFLFRTIAWMLILFVGLPLTVVFWLGLFNLFAGHG